MLKILKVVHSSFEHRQLHKEPNGKIRGFAPEIIHLIITLNDCNFNSINNYSVYTNLITKLNDNIFISYITHIKIYRPCNFFYSRKLRVI